MSIQLKIYISICMLESQLGNLDVIDIIYKKAVPPFWSEMKYVEIAE